MYRYMCVYMYLFMQTSYYIYTHILYIYILYISYVRVCACMYIHIHYFCFSGNPNIDRKLIFKSLWKIERTCFYLDMNNGHKQCQDTLLVSESLRRDSTPLLKTFSVFINSLFLGFLVPPLLHGPPPAAFWI